MFHSWGRLPARAFPCSSSVLKLLRPGPLALGVPQAGGIEDVRLFELRSSSVMLPKPCWLPQVGGSEPCTASRVSGHSAAARASSRKADRLTVRELAPSASCESGPPSPTDQLLGRLELSVFRLHHTASQPSNSSSGGLQVCCQHTPEVQSPQCLEACCPLSRQRAKQHVRGELHCELIVNLASKRRQRSARSRAHTLSRVSDVWKLGRVAQLADSVPACTCVSAAAGTAEQLAAARTHEAQPSVVNGKRA